MEKMFFMSGLNRSGATLLGSILNQNPDIYVNTTSPLVDLCIKSELVLQDLDEKFTFDFKNVRHDLMVELPKIFFKRFHQKYIIEL